MSQVSNNRQLVAAILTMGAWGVLVSLVVLCRTAPKPEEYRSYFNLGVACSEIKLGMRKDQLIEMLKDFHDVYSYESEGGDVLRISSGIDGSSEGIELRIHIKKNEVASKLVRTREDVEEE
jgi:hypothetical protein